MASGWVQANTDTLCACATSRQPPAAKGASLSLISSQHLSRDMTCPAVSHRKNQNMKQRIPSHLPSSAFSPSLSKHQLHTPSSTHKSLYKQPAEISLLGSSSILTGEPQPLSNSLLLQPYSPHLRSNTGFPETSQGLRLGLISVDAPYLISIISRGCCHLQLQSLALGIFSRCRSFIWPAVPVELCFAAVACWCA